MKDLTAEVRFILNVSDLNATCALWDVGTAKWSNDGVWTVLAANNTIECCTQRLTLFAGVTDMFWTNIEMKPIKDVASRECLDSNFNRSSSGRDHFGRSTGNSGDPSCAHVAMPTFEVHTLT